MQRGVNEAIAEVTAAYLGWDLGVNDRQRVSGALIVEKSGVAINGQLEAAALRVVGHVGVG